MEVHDFVKYYYYDHNGGDDILVIGIVNAVNDGEGEIWATMVEDNKVVSAIDYRETDVEVITIDEYLALASKMEFQSYNNPDPHLENCRLCRQRE